MEGKELFEAARELLEIIPGNHLSAETAAKRMHQAQVLIDKGIAKAARAPEQGREMRAEIERLRGFAEEVKQWAEAYPTKIFHEPTPEEVQRACDAVGVTIDCISAMVLRQFVKPWGDKARALLARESAEPAEERKWT